MAASTLDARRLHILMTADAVGGVWTYAVGLIGALTVIGVATTLAVMGPHPTEAQRRAAHAAGATLVELDLPLDWTAPDDIALRQAATALARLAEQLGADLVHLNSPALAGYAPFAMPVLGVAHSCLGTWWAAVRGGPPPDDFAWRIRAAAAGYAACRVLVAPSQAFASATANLYDIARPKVVHNARRPAERGSMAREPLVLTAGRLWDEGKDARTLDRAAGRIDAPLVALGPTRAPDGTSIAFEALRSIGTVDAETAADWMNRASILTSAALYEPFGLSVLEGAQVGAALVLSDIPTFRELWNGAALFVRPGDDAGFAAAFDELLCSPERWLQVSRAAKERSKHYSVEAMGRAYGDLYLELKLHQGTERARAST